MAARGSSTRAVPFTNRAATIGAASHAPWAVRGGFRTTKSIIASAAVKDAMSAMSWFTIPDS